MRKLLLPVLFLTVAVDCCIATSPERKQPFSHAYYLIAIDHAPEYNDNDVPLLITRGPIDRTSAAKGIPDSAVVETDQRNTISQIHNAPPIKNTDISLSEGTLHLYARRYRYQEVDTIEALRLLFHPNGSKHPNGFTTDPAIVLKILSRWRNPAEDQLTQTLIHDLAFESQSKPRFSHVYFLFIEHPSGCEECYIPMMITRESIDKVSLAKGKIDTLVITTYERDSIWQWNDLASLDTKSVSLPERTLRWNGKSYRYQEVDRSEALRLLLHPLGTIPISRVIDPNNTSLSMPSELIPGLLKDLESSR